MKNAITLFFYFISSGSRTDPSTSGGNAPFPPAILPTTRVLRVHRSCDESCAQLC